MNCFRLSYKLFKNNIKVYKLYLLITTVSAAALYNFLSIKNNYAFISISQRLQAATTVSISCGFVLICTVVYFIFSADKFFMLNRQKETALYMLIGVKKSKITQVFIIESLFIGVLSILSGLVFGIILSKLFFMLLAKSIHLNVDIPFQISLNSIYTVILVFSCIFAAVAYRKYRIVKRSKLIDMMNAVKLKEGPQRLKYFKGVLGITLILFGYAAAVMIKKWEIDLMLSSVLALLCVSIGTYFFFQSFMAVVFHRIIKNKKFIYRKARLLSISNVYFRLRDNYRNLAMTAILCAAAITALGLSLSFKEIAKRQEVKETPYSFCYETYDKASKQKMSKMILKNQINENKFILGNVSYKNYTKKVDYNREAVIISNSTLRKNFKFIHYKYPNYIEPKGKGVVFISSASTLSSPFNLDEKEIEINNKDYFIKAQKDDIPFTGIIDKFGIKNVYVLEDREYEKAKKGFKERTLSFVKIEENQNYNQLISEIEKSAAKVKIYTYINQHTWDYYAAEIFYFLGMVMSVIFMLSMFSTIYFKILKDAFMDREQYVILKKLGMSRNQIKKSVYMQVMMFFILPGSIAVLHSMVAMRMLEQIMNFSFKIQFTISLGVYLGIMTLFYIFISSNYVNMVYEEGGNNA